MDMWFCHAQGGKIYFGTNDDGTEVCQQLEFGYRMLGAKNNDSFSTKWRIVKFYTLEYREYGKSNSKNDRCLYMGAFAIPQSVDFRAFAVNVKKIAPTQKLYQSGHAICLSVVPKG